MIRSKLNYRPLGVLKFTRYITAMHTCGRIQFISYRDLEILTPALQMVQITSTQVAMFAHNSYPCMAPPINCCISDNYTSCSTNNKVQKCYTQVPQSVH